MSATPGALRLLDAIERREMISLSWGYVDGSMNAGDINLLAREVLSLPVDSAQDLVEELISDGLLLERHRRLRSRFAETVRLLTKTRQIFRADQWRSAPGLVADFRIDRRPRLFPNRNIDPATCWQSFPNSIRTSDLRHKLWNTLTTDALGNALRLAPFQVRCVERLLAEGRWDNGTIVTAGTGSGKSICFYLPVLIDVAERVTQGSTHTLAIAMYPRNELLKDQLREAVLQGLRLKTLLRTAGSRSIRIGVYYGDTPHSWAFLNGPIGLKSWRRVATGFICPLVRCPSCEGELLWRDDDGNRGIETLRCTRSTCSVVVEDLVLTRDALKDRGCDILFISAESLNQRMTDRRLRRVLGIDCPPAQRPQFVLLDEVHTYGGTQGAQVALMLRRWRHAVNSASIKWVGLSATLRDPEEFFATVTGLRVDHICTVAPSVGELQENGCEYQIVLRGDPSGQTSLLSTTIQTTMLIGRMADPIQTLSSGVVGRKVFVFADNLDVINRLYHNLADAEGYIVRRNSLIPSTRRQVLASFRGDGDDATERDVEGQRWWAAERLGRSLQDRLQLGRTTSQDAGVDSAATVLVATASLEVGFNDPSVGFVIQHKAPRSAATFLQRKGRAGRSQVMRPWTITVLSDYGRDRATFQCFETLFDPTLTSLTLPISNLYVLRIQATFALLEWLYLQWSQRPSTAYLWDLVSKPGYNDVTQQQQRDLALILSRLLRDNDAQLRASLTAHLTQSFGVDEARLRLILWQPPRGIMLEVIPTLIRRMWCNWRLAFPSGIDTELHARTPLPEFLPSKLFSDLQLPEVDVVAADGRPETLAIVAALNQFVPGRVTRRFAPYEGNVSHWIAIDPAASAQVVELNETLQIYDTLNVTINGLRIVRPRRVSLQRVPADVLPTSNAQWIWNTQITGGSAPSNLPLPGKGPWSESIVAIEGYTYRLRSPVNVVRFATGGEATVRTRVNEAKCPFQLVLDGTQVAIGMEQEVDGLRIDIILESEESLAIRTLSTTLAASCRSSLFRERVSTDLDLLKYANVFQLDWMAQAFTAATVTIAEDRGTSFADASAIVTATFVNEAISMLFPQRDTHESPSSRDESNDSYDHDDDVGSDTPEAEQKLVTTLRGQLRDPQLLDRMRGIAGEVFSNTTRHSGAWLRSLACETLAIAFADAAVAALPRNSAADSLLSDWSLNADTGKLSIWLTEQSLGGTGLVEELVVLCGAEPRRLLRSVEAAISPSEMETAVESLAVLCRLIRANSNVADLAYQCSTAIGHEDRTRLLEQLAEELRSRGYSAGRTFGVSLNARLLRIGMSQVTWTLLADLDDYRTALQSRLGVIIDLRVFCRLASEHERYRDRLRAELERMRGSKLRDGEAAQILAGMLWPQSSEVRSARPIDWHPFRRLGISEPQLVRELLSAPRYDPVDVSDEAWHSRASTLLLRDGAVRLSARHDALHLLSAALLTFTVEPVDTGWLLLYIGVEGVELIGDTLCASLSLRDAL